VSAADSILQAIQKINGNAALLAPLASPTFTGVPAAPTAAVDTNTTQAATTAFVLAQAASATPIIDGTGAVGTSTRYARADHVHPSDTTKANLSGGNTFTGTQTMAGPVNSTNGILGAGSPGGTGGTSYGSNAPITLYVKSVTVLTSATPADIATITIPAGITRWMLTSAANIGTVIAETASGTLAGGNFVLFDASGGGGNQMSVNPVTFPAGTTGANSRISINGQLATTAQMWSTSNTLYIRQTANSANAGTVSFYLTIWPIP
jgi:hypothetical protein